MQLTKTVNKISESAMSIWNKPIKFVYLQKLANQSVLDGTNLKEMAKRSTVVFMKKENPWLFDEERKM